MSTEHKPSLAELEEREAALMDFSKDLEVAGQLLAVTIDEDGMEAQMRKTMGTITEKYTEAMTVFPDGRIRELRRRSYHRAAVGLAAVLNGVGWVAAIGTAIGAAIKGRWTVSIVALVVTCILAVISSRLLKPYFSRETGEDGAAEQAELQKLLAARRAAKQRRDTVRLDEPDRRG